MSPDSEPPRTRRRLQAGARSVQEDHAASALRRAQPYHLVTARVPVRALSPTWSLGQNRPLDPRHVRRLQGIFEQGGLNRQAEENRVQALCHREAVARMRRHLHLDAAAAGDRDEEPPSFADWLAVNGAPAELLAGQHRLRALEAYAAQIGAGDEELWWTCDFYDCDTLPHDLNVQLRINRQDVRLPDSHGQIWVQIAAASAQDGRLQTGRAVDLEREITDVLRLQAEPQFPLRRLVTVWRNAAWRAMATRWCATRLGRDTFQISTWEWMSSCRIHDFWFTVLSTVLATLQQMPGNAAATVSAGDWRRLARDAPSPRTPAQVAELFYPGQPPPPASGVGRRRAGFLAALDAEGYWATYQRVLQCPQLRFPDVHRLLGMARHEGRALAAVVRHVVAWVNPHPAVITNRRDNEKPLLREDLVPALRRCTRETLRRAEQRLPELCWDPTPPTPTAEAAAEAASLLLQQEVLFLALPRLPELRPDLDDLPAQVPPDQYARRFRENAAWAAVLHAVRQYLGPDFQPQWQTAAPDDPAPPGTARQAVADLVASFCDHAARDVPQARIHPPLRQFLQSPAFRAGLSQLLAPLYSSGADAPVAQQEAGQGDDPHGPVPAITATPTRMHRTSGHPGVLPANGGAQGSDGDHPGDDGDPDPDHDARPLPVAAASGAQPEGDDQHPGVPSPGTPNAHPPVPSPSTSPPPSQSRKTRPTRPPRRVFVPSWLKGPSAR